MIKKTKEWREGKKVSRQFSMQIPEREEDDLDDITPNQIKYLQSLAPDLQWPDGIERLGKWQASAIIDAIKEAKAELQGDASMIGRDEKQPKKSRSNAGWYGLVLIMIAVILSDQCSK